LLDRAADAVVGGDDRLSASGAVRIEVNRPRMGGRFMSDAIASPYGRAMSAARKPPLTSPASFPKL
jgi:hypothetical protein